MYRIPGGTFSPPVLTRTSKHDIPLPVPEADLSLTPHITSVKTLESSMVTGLII